MTCTGSATVAADGLTESTFTAMTLKQFEVDIKNSEAVVQIAGDQGNGASDVNIGVSWADDLLEVNPFVVSSQKYGYATGAYTDPSVCVIQKCATEMSDCDAEKTCKSAWEQHDERDQITISDMMATPLLIPIDRCTMNNCIPVSSDFQAQLQLNTSASRIGPIMESLKGHMEMEISARNSARPTRMFLSFGTAEAVTVIDAQPWLAMGDYNSNSDSDSDSGKGKGKGTSGVAPAVTATAAAAAAVLVALLV
jgi:hypothetical protein